MQYSYFASYYDALTKNIDYDKQGRYILALLEKYGHKAGLTLDLACGTGSLTLWLKQQGIDVFGADMSADMLTMAQQKAYEAGENILYLHQRMEKLDLYGNIDTCVCTLDSLNHLKSEKEVQKTFDRVAHFMNSGGYFVFDMNTLYKHSEILGDNTFVYETKDVFCVWQNSLHTNGCTVNITLDFFEKENSVYRRYGESFSETAYTVEKTQEMLKKAGFELLDVFEELTFDPPSNSAQRNYFIARKE